MSDPLDGGRSVVVMKIQLRQPNFLLPLCIVAGLTLTLLVWSTFHHKKSESYFGNHFDIKDLRMREDDGFSPIKCSAKDFESFMNLARESQSDDCNPLREVFELEWKQGVLNIPKQLEVIAAGWLGGDPALIEKFHNQAVVQVFNRFTRTTTIFNPLRASRPQPKMDRDPLEYIRGVAAESESECQFCKYREFTGTDKFGRFESNLATNAANAFKLNDFHALVLPKVHDVTAMTFDVYSEAFEIAMRWFKQVQIKDRLDSSTVHDFPLLTFDSMPHSGASQVHPHFQIMIGQGHYLGQFRDLHMSAQDYRGRTGGRQYITDYVKIHFELGLAVRFGEAVLLSPIDSHKDHEVLVISEQPGRDWKAGYYAVIKTFLLDLKVVCWSSGTAWPSVTGEAVDSLPAIAKVGSRGNCQSMMSDVSSFELYMWYNVNTNPYKTIEAVKQTIEDPAFLSEVHWT